MSEREDTTRCATEGCEAEGTERLRDEFVCPACYQAAFQREYDRERRMGLNGNV